MELDEIVAAAAREADDLHGVTTRGRLRELGASDHQIDVLIARGRVAIVGRGVLRFAGTGHPITQQLAAALFTVPRAAAARRWALWLYGLLGSEPAGAPCLLVPYGASVRGGEHLCLHRSRSFTGRAVGEIGRFRVASVERAIVESWPELTLGAWRGCLQRGLQRSLTDVPRLLQSLEALGRVRGAARIKRELQRQPAQVARSRSTGELALLGAFARAGLPEPLLNHEVATNGGNRRELDAAFPHRRLAYELDGRDWHSTPDQVASDQLRDLELSAAGWTIHRIPARLLATPAQLERLLRSTFDAHSPRP